jgi:hypothetical protein
VDLHQTESVGDEEQLSALVMMPVGSGARREEHVIDDYPVLHGAKTRIRPRATGERFGS